MSSRWGAVALTLGIVCGGCASGDSTASEQTADPEMAAVWRLAPNERPSAEARELPIQVIQVSCNDGKTNRVRSVSTAYSTDAVTITVSVEPVSSGAHNCQGGLPRSYSVELDEPIGKRKLVDGQCSGGNVAKTSWCDPDGVRHDPTAPVPTGPFQVRGRLLLVGGPAGTEPRVLRTGEVRFTGPVTRTARFTRSGDFVVNLPPGRYDVAGRTPESLDGAWACSAPELTVTDEHTSLDVVCSMK